MSLLKGLPWLAAAVLVSGYAEAAIVTFDDRTVWTSGVSDVVTRTFDGPGPGGFIDYGNSSGLTLAGVNFIGKYSTVSYFLHIVNASGGQPWYDWSSGAILRADPDSTDRRIIATVPLGTYAFGVDLATGGINASDLSVRINGTSTYTLTTLNRPNLKFFGVTSDTPITMIEFLYPTAGIYPILDNFSTATVNPGGGEETPEAASLILCATGLVWIARMGRRRLQPSKLPA